MSISNLSDGFRAYSAWRTALSTSIEDYRSWLARCELEDAPTLMRLRQLTEHLNEDRLVVAFVAGSSAGKSELINAIFFAEHGWRLPSDSGRTTSCPTELLWDRSNPPRVELLPIETRVTHSSVSEYKTFPEEWRVIPLDLESAGETAAALARPGDSRRVSRTEARALGLIGDSDPDPRSCGDDTVEIPCWRHAMINCPHPLLAQGLIILDTPGPIAPRGETDSGHTLPPGTRAVLFIVAANTGITASDLEAWRNDVLTTESGERCRFAVLNKIDCLWDETKPPAEIDAEIEEQIASCSRALGLPRERIFPVSAQKGLEAKISANGDLLVKSRLAELERALAAELISARHEITRGLAREGFAGLTGASRSMLEFRRRGVLDQLKELEYLRGKNRGVVRLMMEKVNAEKRDFERGMTSYQALRSVFSAQADRLLTHLSMEAVSEEWRKAREEMVGGTFSSGERPAMSRFFRRARRNLDKAAGQAAEIGRLMEAMYRKFSEEHALRLSKPTPFSMLKYLKEIERLETSYENRPGTLVAMLTIGKLPLRQRLSGTFASQVRRCFRYANREVEEWLRAIMSPMEMQVRERQTQLRRRLESIQRIHQATGTLAGRIEELAAVEARLAAQIGELDRISADFERALELRGDQLAQAA